MTRIYQRTKSDSAMTWLLQSWPQIEFGNIFAYFISRPGLHTLAIMETTRLIQFFPGRIREECLFLDLSTFGEEIRFAEGQGKSQPAVTWRGKRSLDHSITGWKDYLCPLHLYGRVSFSSDVIIFVCMHACMADHVEVKMCMFVSV